VCSRVTINEDNELEEKFDCNAEKRENTEVIETEDLRSQIELMRKEVETERKKGVELTNRMKYLQADLVNLQRQADRTVAEARNQVRLSWILELISIKEDLERAIKVVTPSDNRNLVNGLNLIVSRLESIMKSEEVDRIAADPGSKFDPRIHEAVAYQETEDQEQGRILSVISPGYTTGGKVIKPTLVEVTRRMKAKLSEDKKDEELSPLTSKGKRVRRADESSSNEDEKSAKEL